MAAAYSPVLLPTRVVQALNLNVHNNGIHISPRSGFSGGHHSLLKEKNICRLYLKPSCQIEKEQF